MHKQQLVSFVVSRYLFHTHLIKCVAIYDKLLQILAEERAQNLIEEPVRHSSDESSDEESRGRRLQRGRRPVRRSLFGAQDPAPSPQLVELLDGMSHLQDTATEAFEMLRQAMALEQSQEDSAILEQVADQYDDQLSLIADVRNLMAREVTSRENHMRRVFKLMNSNAPNVDLLKQVTGQEVAQMETLKASANALNAVESGDRTL